MSIRSHSGASLFLLLCLFGLSALPVESQSEQVVEVVIKDFTFVTKQEVLRLGLPTVIKIVNKDNERHDFGSTMFEGLQARIEKDGVIVYGRGLGGVMLDPKRDATIRFNMESSGSRTPSKPPSPSRILSSRIESPGPSRNWIHTAPCQQSPRT